MSPYQKHLAAIESGRVTRTNIIGLRKALNMDARRSAGWSIGVTAAKITSEELEHLLHLIATTHVIAHGDLHEAGLKVLRNKRHAKKWDATQAAIIEKFDHFRLVRFDWIGARGEHCVPVYRAYGAGLQSFTFRNIPWQSGGKGPEIQGRDF